jgi:hypothetical protein
MSWLTTGIRPITMNLEKAIGFTMSQMKLKNLIQYKGCFYEYIRKI